MTVEVMIDALAHCGARLDGHFLLSSGNHSGEYFQCAKILEKTDKPFPLLLMKELSNKIYSGKPDVIISPAVGGVRLGFGIGLQLKLPNIFAESKEDVRILKRGFNIKSGKLYTVVDDVVTTGKSVNEIINLVEDGGGEVISVACLIDRSNGQIDFGVPLFSMLKINVVKWSPEECPLCERNTLLVKPGSREFNELINK